MKTDSKKELKPAESQHETKSSESKHEVKISVSQQANTNTNIIVTKAEDKNSTSSGNKIIILYTHSKFTYK